MGGNFDDALTGMQWYSTYGFNINNRIPLVWAYCGHPQAGCRARPATITNLMDKPQ